MAEVQEKLEYVGFWARVGATIIDSILILIIYSLFSQLFMELRIGRAKTWLKVQWIFY